MTGFTEFIVDPSFQVMGDMLEKVLIPLHRQQPIPSAVVEVISEEVCESQEKKQDKTTSTSSPVSRPNTPRKSVNPRKNY